MNSQNNNNTADSYKDGETVHQLPGFRFHPTDEELVGFYLRRKVEKKPLRIELIKQIDIYKHDPWDLPKMSSTADKEGYFFCKRGRKYRNSVRPNRVTGSGFWKATGIDKPVYSSSSSRAGEGRECIGLKKTLVYYRGNAGKGTKTDWMMNEFRLPSKDNCSNNVSHAKTTMPEAEVWTICRIFKRNVSYKKYKAERNQSSAMELPSSTITYPIMEPDNQEEAANYISFENSNNKLETAVVDHINERKHQFSNLDQLTLMSSSAIASNNPHESMASSSSYPITAYGNNNLHELFSNVNCWDELRSVVDFSLDPLFI